MLSPQALKSETAQFELFNLDSSFGSRLTTSKPKLELSQEQRAQLERLMRLEAEREEYSAIYRALALNGEFELDGGAKAYSKSEFDSEKEEELVEQEFDTLLLLLIREGASRDNQCAVLDWMIGGLLSWNDTQLTLMSFCTACRMELVDARSFGETVLHYCVYHDIVPNYARMHLAAWRWLERLPNKKQSGEQKRARLRWVFTPLLSEAETRMAPLLPEPQRSEAIHQFRSTCAEFGANLELTRKLLWVHCVRWRVVPFDVHKRLAATA